MARTPSEATVSRPSDEARARAIVDALMEDVKFEQGLAWLNGAYARLDGLKPTRGPNAHLGTIREVSQRLLPWLYIPSLAMPVDRWERQELGEIMWLPVGLETFAEIVLAGLDCRKALFDGKDRAWPLGFHMVAFQPEGGHNFLSTNLNSLRTHLAKIVNVPPRVLAQGEVKIDESINIQLEFKLLHNQRDDRVRTYWFCETNDAERTALMEAVAKTYPTLAVIDLNSDTGPSQTTFNKISHLFDLAESEKIA